jgi:hypothetical protein
MFNAAAEIDSPSRAGRSVNPLLSGQRVQINVALNIGELLPPLTI